MSTTLYCSCSTASRSIWAACTCAVVSPNFSSYCLLIVVANAPESNSVAAAEHTLALAREGGALERQRAAAAAHGLAHEDIVSGAGHDAVYVARVAPTAMIFVPCKDGISHNEVEDAQPEHLAAGCQVLCDALVATAGRAD